MQCVQLTPEGVYQAIQVEPDAVCSTNTFVIESTEYAWAALWLDPQPHMADIQTAAMWGFGLLMSCYLAAWAIGEIVSMFSDRNHN